MASQLQIVGRSLTVGAASRCARIGAVGRYVP